MSTKSIFFNQGMEINQSRIVYGYMILARLEMMSFFVNMTTFYFFRSVYSKAFQNLNFMGTWCINSEK